MHWMPAFVGTTAQLLAVSMFFLQNYRRHESVDTSPDLLTDEYDYIVVGSASAGAIVAHRLAEDRKTMVLLIEAALPIWYKIDNSGWCDPRCDHISNIPDNLLHITSSIWLANWLLDRQVWRRQKVVDVSWGIVICAGKLCSYCHCIFLW